MKKRAGSLSVIIVLVAIIAIISNTKSSFNAFAKPAENNQALHAVSSEKLRQIMQNLRASIDKDGTGTLPSEKISEEQMADLLEAVEELVFHAELLTEGKPNVNLNENELVTFRALAGQLYTEALNIKQLTTYYDYNVLIPAYDRMTQTCSACHSLFRKDKQ